MLEIVQRIPRYKLLLSGERSCDIMWHCKIMWPQYDSHVTWTVWSCATCACVQIMSTISPMIRLTEPRVKVSACPIDIHTRWSLGTMLVPLIAQQKFEKEHFLTAKILSNILLHNTWRANSLTWGKLYCCHMQQLSSCFMHAFLTNEIASFPSSLPCISYTCTHDADALEIISSVANHVNETIRQMVNLHGEKISSWPHDDKIKLCDNLCCLCHGMDSYY